MDDEVMAVPPEDMFAGPAPTPGRTPGSVGGPLGGAAPLPGLSDMRITPPSLPGLPDLGGGASGATSAGGFALGDDVEPLPMSDGMEGMDGMEAPPPEGELAEAGASAQQQRRRRQPPAHRRRRPTVDVQADGRPATTLPSEQIRKLLADRKPLMVRRGLRTQRQAATLPPRGFDVVRFGGGLGGTRGWGATAGSYMVLCVCPLKLSQGLGRSLQIIPRPNHPNCPATNLHRQHRARQRGTASCSALPPSLPWHPSCSTSSPTPCACRALPARRLDQRRSAGGAAAAAQWQRTRKQRRRPLPRLRWLLRMRQLRQSGWRRSRHR